MENRSAASIFIWRNFEVLVIAVIFSLPLIACENNSEPSSEIDQNRLTIDRTQSVDLQAAAELNGTTQCNLAESQAHATAFLVDEKINDFGSMVIGDIDYRSVLPIHKTSDGVYQYQLSIEASGEYTVLISCDVTPETVQSNPEGKFIIGQKFTVVIDENGSFDPNTKSTTHLLNTADNCQGCHTLSPQYVLTYVDHKYVTGTCDGCHFSATHPVFNQGETCVSCHNGIQATGKSNLHLPTSDICESCHNMNNWLVSAVDHGEVFGVCDDCHNNQLAQGKPATHISSSNVCEACHDAGDAWIPIRIFDHNHAIGECDDCHNSVIASGKSDAHIPTTLPCDTCHSNLQDWNDLTFDHTPFTVDDCLMCHDGVTASGKSAVHINTSLSCGVCHSTDAWLPSS